MTRVHRPEACPRDESCRGCVDCDRATGETVCDRCCPHASANAKAMGYDPGDDEDEADPEPPMTEFDEWERRLEREGFDI